MKPTRISLTLLAAGLAAAALTSGCGKQPAAVRTEAAPALAIRAQAAAERTFERRLTVQGTLEARNYANVAAAKSADYDAKAREGLIPLGDALDARAARDLAQVAMVQSQYQERIALANLELAMGSTLVPGQNSEPKAEK